MNKKKKKITYKLQSIKTKLNLTIFGTIIIMFFMITVPVFIGYESYYVSQQKDLLQSANSQITKNVDSINAIAPQLMIIENREQINTILLDSSEEIIYSSNRLLLSNQHYNSIYDFNSNFEISKTNLKNNYNSYIILEATNNISNVENLHLITSFKLNDEIYYIVLEKPMTNVSSVINGIIVFLLICIIPMSLVASIIVTKVSGFIISPILELSAISEEIASFKFDTPVNIRTNDEIGTLAQNMQILSLELKSKIEELESQNLLLEESVKEKDKNAKIQREFISNVSHELRTPITLILGYSEALKMDIDEKTKKEYMGIIISESHKMNNLISDMLDISRLQSGDKQLIKEKFDFSELINKITQKHKITFDNNNINFSKSIIDNGIIYGDKSKLELVISNFITNAVRYVDNKKIINIELSETSDTYVFKIYNTSKPLEKDDIKKIWGSFYKVDKAHSREKGGTGIGLYLVKTILELHNFDYGVRNIDDGVEFYIEIPKGEKI